jgi:hypothetical protein
MDPHAIGMQGGMTMPTSMGMGTANPQAMAMNMYAQPQMMMNMGQMPAAGVSMPMAQPQPQQMMNPAAVSGAMQMGGVPSADWRIQLTREHRANLIAKIYNEMVRVCADPVPGIKLWMNVSWYELTLYKESPTQEVYINKIFTRLKSLRAQQSDMSAAMAAQGLPNQGMLSRLDFSYYNTLNLSQRGATGGQMASYPGHNQFGGPGPHPGAQHQQQETPMISGGTPVKTETSMTASAVAEYWTQHSALRAKHQGDVEKVHSAFKKYVDHMKGHDETEQKKKLRYLLSYVELCANILSEDKATHPPRKIEELDKVFKYIVKIVNPYLKKLRTETDKRSYPTGDSSSSSAGAGSTAGPTAPTSSGGPTSTGASTMPTSTSSGFSSAMTQPQGAGQTQQQNKAPSASQNQTQQTPQQKQQQYIMQQRTQQMQQQQQRMRQQQLMQQQQMMQQQQQQMQKGSQQQQLSAQQANQMKQQQQNSQNAANQQSGQQTQQQLGQQGPARPQQKPQQPQQTQPQQQQNQQPPTSREENPSISSGLSLGLDDSFYGSMGNDLLQMPTPSGTSSGLMDFSSALSPTSFGGMDLLDWDDGTGTSGQGTSGPNTSGGDSADLMTFVETL